MNNNPAPQASSIDGQVQLKRTLKLKDLVFYGMIMMVLIAPMAVFGEIEQASGGMTPFVYLVGVIAMVFTALSYMQMSRRFPVGGSVYAYVQRGINHHVGFVAGWMILLDYIFVPALLYALVSNICVETFPGIPGIAWIIAFIVVNTLINVRGIDYTAKADIILFFIELVVVVIFLIGGISFIAGGGGTGGFSVEPLYQPGKINLNFIASACTIAALSFLGFDGISTLAEEALEPARDIGKAIMIALISIGILFIVETYVACLILPDWQHTDIAAGFYDAAALALGEWFRIVMVGVTIVAAGIANTMVAQSSAARLLYTMGRDRVIPHIFAKVHPKFRTPYVGIYLLSIFSLVIAIAVPIDTLVRLVNFGALASFIMLNFATFFYFFIKQKLRSGAAFIKNLVCPFVGMAILIYVFTGFDSISYIVGFGWLIIGVVIGFIKSKGYKEVPEAFKNIEL